MLQGDQEDGAFRVGSERCRKAIRPEIAVLDIRQIEHHKKCVVCRQYDWITLDFVEAAEISDGQFGFPERLCHHRLCVCCPKRACNSLACVQHCTYNDCADHPPDLCNHSVWK